MESEITTMLGQLLIANSVYKGPSGIMARLQTMKLGLYTIASYI